MVVGMSLRQRTIYCALARNIINRGASGFDRVVPSAQHSASTPVRPPTCSTHCPPHPAIHNIRVPMTSRFLETYTLRETLEGESLQDSSSFKDGENRVEGGEETFTTQKNDTRQKMSFSSQVAGLNATPRTNSKRTSTSLFRKKTR